MRRITLAILMLAALIAAPVLAQQQGHVVAMPDTLKWVEPATLPGTRLAVLQGDPSKEGLFVYRLKMPAQYKIPPPVAHPVRARAVRGADGRGRTAAGGPGDRRRA